jgi:hypothetical protein
MTPAEFISLVSILVALGTLIWQTKQRTDQLRLQNFASYTDRYQKIMLNLPIAIESQNFDLNALNTDQKEQTLRWLRAYFDLCSEEYYLRENGLVADKVWKLWKAGMSASIRKPAYRQGWEILQTNQYYSKEFDEFIRFSEQVRGDGK